MRMRKLYMALAAGMFLAGVAPVSAAVMIKDAAGKEIGGYAASFALVIGVDDYQEQGWPDLPGVKTDIERVSTSLKRHGFDVTVVRNPTRAEMDATMLNFRLRHGSGAENRMLFYFAGHGYTLTKSWGGTSGYIVPADAPDPARDRSGFETKALDMAAIEVYAKQVDAKHMLFLFDSCFSGALFAIQRAAPASITYKTSLPVRQFITAGKEDEKVPDTSIFCAQFVAALDGEADGNRDGYVTGEELGFFLSDKVINYSYNTQHPQYGRIRNPQLDRGDFVFQVAALALGAVEPIRPAATRPPPPGPSVVELTGALQVRSPEAGQVRIDGGAAHAIRAGQMLKWDALPVGAHRIEVVCGGKTWAETVTVEEGRTAQATAAFGAKPGDTMSVDLGGGVKLELVWVESGTFTMGKPAGKEAISVKETQHRVTLTKGYWMGKFEVTQRQWEAVMGSNPSNFKTAGLDAPVETVSWDDCQAFIRKLNGLAGGSGGAPAGYAYRLPTEAEWEYACRAGTTTPFHYGSHLDASMANFHGDFPYGDAPKGEYRQTTVTVGGFQPNAFGLYDMHGNVWEWCEDWYGDYPTGSVTDPKGASSGSFRVLRGGCLMSLANYLRSAARDFNDPTKRCRIGGLRVVLSR